MVLTTQPLQLVGSDVPTQQAAVTFSVKLRHAAHPGWLFDLRFTKAGRLVDFRMRSDAAEPKGRMVDDWPSSGAGQPVTTRLLRQVPLGEIQAAARRAVLDQSQATASMMTEHADRGWGQDLAKLAADWARSFETTARPGRRGRDDRYYAVIAALYVHLVEQGEPTPLKRLAHELRLSASRVRTVLYEARKRKLLTDPPIKGGAGGELTEKALHLDLTKETS